MIAAEGAAAAFDDLLALMERQAAELAEARARSAQMERAGDERRWRKPDLLWPTLIKGF